MNYRMKEMLDKGEALDVCKIGRPLAGNPDVFVLDEFHEGLDYCDAKAERWIWSIGKDLATGKIYASVDVRFYQEKGFECVWLR